MSTYKIGPLEVTVTGHSVNPMETEGYQLDRLATARKKAGDWDGAIDALRRRKALDGLAWQDMKLAKYLQQAGRFDEAMAEVDWLLLHVPRWAEHEYSQRRASSRQSTKASLLMRMHAGAALICKREQRSDLQSHHSAMSERYASIHRRLHPIVRQENKAAREAVLRAAK